MTMIPKTSVADATLALVARQRTVRLFAVY